MAEVKALQHPFPPVFDKNSTILILGSFPSEKSRETGFYYGNPQNRFWRVCAMVFGDTVPKTNNEKTKFLLKNGIALWDSVSSCRIEGSSDSSIRNAVPNDISFILKTAPISKIFANGTLAYNLYQKYILPTTGIDSVKLPSTSPANAAWSLERLESAWKVIKENQRKSL